MTSWAVDLKDVGAIYPFQGSEMLMVILAVVFWLGWHYLQLREENSEIAGEMKSSPEEIKKAIDRY